MTLLPSSFYGEWCLWNLSAYVGEALSTQCFIYAVVAQHCVSVCPGVCAEICYFPVLWDHHNCCGHCYGYTSLVELTLIIHYYLTLVWPLFHFQAGTVQAILPTMPFTFPFLCMLSIYRVDPVYYQAAKMAFSCKNSIKCNQWALRKGLLISIDILPLS